jgi:hypothetical protein
MRRFLIPIIAACLAAAPAAAQQTQAFHSPAADFTVQLPAAWRPLPDAVIAALQQSSARAGEGLNVEAGYRVTGTSFLVISWVDMGQEVTPEQFAQETTGASAQAGMQEGAGLVREGARVGAPVWDAENRTVWTRSEVPPSGQAAGQVSVSALTLHPNGRTVVTFALSAAQGQDEARMRAHLLQVVRSLRAD